MGKSRLGPEQAPVCVSVGKHMPLLLTVSRHQLQTVSISPKQPARTWHWKGPGRYSHSLLSHRGEGFGPQRCTHLSGLWGSSVCLEMGRGESKTPT